MAMPQLQAAAISPAEAQPAPPKTSAAETLSIRYCLCQRISFGEMIACDNDDCPIEWFHYGCVGITEENRPKSE